MFLEKRNYKKKQQARRGQGEQKKQQRAGRLVASDEGVARWQLAFCKNVACEWGNA